MSSAFDAKGHAVNVGDQISVIATVSSVAGTGPTATVTAIIPLATGTVNVQANDCRSTQNQDTTTYPARDYSGNAFGNAYDQLTIMGQVTSISGSGNDATLTVQCKSSGNSISVPAGSCYCNQ